MLTLTPTKICTTCRREKSLDDFNVRDGKLVGRCKTCRRAADQRAGWGRGPRQQAKNLLRSHGMTPEEYEALLEAQGGVCAICRGPGRADATHPRLIVDHDHRSGRVRGLLCNPCNLGVANFADEPQRLYAAAAYIVRDAMEAAA